MLMDKRTLLTVTENIWHIQVNVLFKWSINDFQGESEILRDVVFLSALKVITNDNHIKINKL